VVKQNSCHWLKKDDQELYLESHGWAEEQHLGLHPLPVCQRSDSEPCKVFNHEDPAWPSNISMFLGSNSLPQLVGM
jgi:hypothetical protein